MNTKGHEEKDNKFNYRGHREHGEFLDRITPDNDPPHEWRVNFLGQAGNQDGRN